MQERDTVIKMGLSLCVFVFLCDCVCVISKRDKDTFHGFLLHMYVYCDFCTPRVK